MNPKPPKPCLGPSGSSSTLNFLNQNEHMQNFEPVELSNSYNLPDNITITIDQHQSPESTVSFLSAPDGFEFDEPNTQAQQEQVEVEVEESSISQGEADDNDIEGRLQEEDQVDHTHSNSRYSIPSFPDPYPPSFVKSDHSFPLSPSSSSSPIFRQTQGSLAHSLFSSRQSSLLGIHRRPNSANVIKIQNDIISLSQSESGKRDLAVADQILKNIHDKELDKHILLLAFPMLVGFVFSSNPLSMTIEMHVVAVTLSFAVAAVWNSILLRNVYSQAVTDMFLMAGITSLFLSFFTFVGCYVPLHIKWIPWLCGLASLFPFILFLLTKMKGT